jgi:hypothetical protein
VRKLRRFLEPLRREILSEMVGDPETRSKELRYALAEVGILLSTEPSELVAPALVLHRVAAAPPTPTGRRAPHSP